MFFPIFIVISTYSYEILVYFIGDSYALGSTPLKILAVGNFFYGLALLLMELIAADGKPKISVKNIAFAAIINVILNLALIPFLGMIGSALSTLTSSTIFLLLSLKSVKNIVKLQINRIRIIKLLLVALFTALFAFTINSIYPITGFISLGIYSALTVLFYSISVITLKSLRYEDVSMAQALMTKFKMPKQLESTLMPILKAAIPNSKN